jgi:MoaA/NifB/PqqE/SkfB family radical SAM enzyme
MSAVPAPRQRNNADDAAASRLIVLWRIFTFCNLDCSFCGYAKSEKIPRVAVPFAEIERVGSLLADDQQRHGTQVLVSWLGGEPLLWPDVRKASALYRSLGLQVSLTTNGTTLARPDIQALVLEMLSEVTISLDIHGPTHDRYRGQESFAAIVSATRQLVRLRNQRHAPLRIRINAILMRDTVEFVSDFIALLDEMGVDEVTFNELGGIERPPFWNSHRLEPQHVDLFAQQLAHAAPQRLRVVAAPLYLERLRASAEGRKLAVTDCQAIGRFLFINEQGLTGPCPFIVDRVGRNIATVRTAEDLAALAQDFRSAQGGGPCLDCKSTFNFGKFA